MSFLDSNQGCSIETGTSQVTKHWVRVNLYDTWDLDNLDKKVEPTDNVDLVRFKLSDMNFCISCIENKSNHTLNCVIETSDGKIKHILFSIKAGGTMNFRNYKPYACPDRHILYLEKESVHSWNRTKQPHFLIEGQPQIFPLPQPIAFDMLIGDQVFRCRDGQLSNNDCVKTRRNCISGYRSCAYRTPVDTEKVENVTSVETVQTVN